MKRPVIVVPWRTDHGRREVIWKYVRKQIISTGLPYFPSDCEGDQWNLAAAVNAGVVRARYLVPDWDSVVVWTADCSVADIGQIEQAVSECDRGMTHAYDQTTRLNAHGTKQLTSGAAVTPEGIEFTRPDPNGRMPVGGIHVTPRWLWEEIGGMDGRYVGWGGEDFGYYRAATTFGEHSRVPGMLYSLHHRNARGRMSHNNRQLNISYREALGDREEMRKVLDGRLETQRYI